MVESSKILSAIQEKSKWTRREMEILQAIDDIKGKKGELIKEAKELKNFIERYNEIIRTSHKGKVEAGTSLVEDNLR